MKRRAGACVFVLLSSGALASPAFAQHKKPAAENAQPAPPAQPRDLVAKGQAQFDDQQYEESIQTLSAALLRPSNTPAQKVDIYRLLALNYITLNRKEEADNAVRSLLIAQPDYHLPASESPRFRDFFAKVREKWEAEGRPGLVKETPQAKPVALKHATPSQAEAGKTMELHARVDDPDGRTGTVKLYYRAGSQGDFDSSLADLGEDGSVHARIPGSEVKPPVMDYYFEVLDGAGSVLASRGDPQAPLRVAVPEKRGGGWVVPLAIGGGILGAAAIVGGLALAGVFSGSDSARGTSTVSVSVGETSFR